MKNQSNNTLWIHEFCLDWQMGLIPREELIEDFVKEGISFSNFKSEAIQNGWWVSSMEEIRIRLLN